MTLAAIQKNENYVRNTYERIKMKKQIIVICVLSFLVVITSCNRTSHLLPEKYNLSTKETFNTAISYGRILKVKSPIEVEDLKSYPKDYKKNVIRTEEKTLVNWIRLDEISNKEMIIANIRQTLDFEDSQQIDKLLNQIENDKNEIYFAGLGDVMKGLNNEKHNFYQFMYFLNLRTNEIYELDDIH